MTEEKLAKWKETRKKGTLNFILMFSLFWGITTGILFVLFAYFLSRYLDIRNTILFEPWFIITTIIAFLIGGIFVAISNWNGTELEYKKSISNTNLNGFNF